MGMNFMTALITTMPISVSVLQTLKNLTIIRNQHFKAYNISATGNETWCATVTKPESLEIDGDNWGLCMDEKSLAYDGGTAGEPCSFPFLMNEK